MSECDKCKRWLSAYIDNELGEDEKQKIKSHVASCQSCNGTMSDLISVRETLTRLPKHKTSRTFNTVLQAQLRREIRHQENPVHFFKGIFRIPAYAAVAILLIAAGIFLDRSFFMEETPRTAGMADIILEIEKAPAKEISMAEESEENPRVLKNYVIVNEQFSSQENLPNRVPTTDSKVQTANRSAYSITNTTATSGARSGFRLQQASLETVEF